MKVEEFKIQETIKIGEVVLNGSRVLAKIVVLKVAKNFTVSWLKKILLNNSHLDSLPEKMKWNYIKGV